MSVDTRNRSISGWGVSDPGGAQGIVADAMARLGYDGWELVVGLPELPRDSTTLEHAHIVFRRSRPG